MKKETNLKLIATICVFGLLFTLALSNSMWNTMLPQFQDEFSLSLSQIGVFNGVMSIGSLISAFLSGTVSTRISKRSVFLIFYPLYVVLLVAVSFVRSFALLLILMVAMGACSGTTMMAGNVYIAKIYTDRKTKILNLLHTIWGVGQFTAPAYVVACFNHNILWRNDFRIIGLIIFPAGVLFLALLIKSNMDKLIPKSENVAQAEESSPNVRNSGTPAKLIFTPLMFTLCVFLFCQTYFQNSMMNWIPVFLTNYYKMDATSMGFAASSLWVGITAGRVLYSIFISDKHTITYLKFSSIAASCIILVTLLLNIGKLWLFAAPLTGLIICAIYPDGVALTCDCFPQNSDFAQAFSSFVVQIGCMLMSTLLGIVAERISFRIAMAIPAVLYLFAFWGFGLIKKMRE